MERGVQRTLITHWTSDDVGVVPPIYTLLRFNTDRGARRKIVGTTPANDVQRMMMMRCAP